MEWYNCLIISFIVAPSYNAFYYNIFIILIFFRIRVILKINFHILSRYITYLDNLE